MILLERRDVTLRYRSILHSLFLIVVPVMPILRFPSTLDLGMTCLISSEYVGVQMLPYPMLHPPRQPVAFQPWTVQMQTTHQARHQSPQIETPGLARPPQAHLNGANAQVQRPIHMLRAPSFNPPSFDEIEAPPPLVTPPPLYDNVIGTPSHDGLADYFAR